MAQTITKIVGSLDWYIINRVKKLRIERGLSQLHLSILMDMAESTIGKIESPACRAKYSIRGLGNAARALKCHTSELLPNYAIPYDKIRLTLEVTTRKGRKYYKLIKEEPIHL